MKLLRHQKIMKLLCDTVKEKRSILSAQNAEKRLFIRPQRGAINARDA
jgi:hypothetical protein